MHIGIILDGNRRWAKRQGWKPWQGHEKGFDKLDNLFDWLLELDIFELSLYCFSIQNFDRPEIEKKFLFDRFRLEAKKLLEDKRIYDNKVKIRFAGRLEMFPSDMQELMKQVMEKTASHDKYIVNFAMAYGGREEIVDGVKKLVASGEAVNKDNIQKNMWVPEDMDVVIRTSGEFRTSGFFPWQAHYAEFFFLEKCWPEFEKEDLIRIVEEFKAKRERRFGK
ncbi:di-trans,poly-cis-decaprenylcistransferase [Candidatus Woesearchaeota archaeon]|nr:di-trans,poly-cis-decaprenylcistransferase [Candidatus Woesearchaeota archaeon]